MYRTVLICAALLAAVAPTCLAWGPFGHRVVAAVAWSKLDPNTRNEVSRLLKMNPSYSHWVQGTTEAERDEIAFISAATWPDDIKGDDRYDNSEGNHPKLGKRSAQNIGYDDFLQHRYWHFYDKPFSPDHTKLIQPDKVNALTQVRLFEAALKSSPDYDIKSYDIAWLIHIVGDLHQPLHAVSRFDKPDPKGDQGGNLICIQPGPKKCKVALHSFWDGVPGHDRGPRQARLDADKLSTPDSALASVIDPLKWIEESFEEAMKWVYVDPIGIGGGPFPLTTKYRKDADEVVDRRIALAGARLAAFINQNLRVPHQ